MVCDTPNKTPPLIPDRYPQHDLFICDVADAVLKDVMSHMEHPFYSLSKKPETSVRRYEHNGNWLEITPSVKGLATIYDKDILIYCISQLIAKLKKGEPLSQRVRISSRDLLMFTNRGTGGKDYRALIEALDRLEGTRIRTNIRSGDEEQMDGFGLIDATSVRRELGLDGRLLWCEIKLSDWVFNAIRSQEVLTLHRDYFRLRKPIERRVYELARKHCGHQREWRASVATLYKKSGSKSPLKEFRRSIKHLAEHNHLPDYIVDFDRDSDVVIFHNRDTMNGAAKAELGMDDCPRLNPDTYGAARKVAPSYDVYYLEQEWREMWVASGKPKFDSPDAAFVGFCRKRYEMRPSP